MCRLHYTHEEVDYEYDRSLPVPRSRPRLEWAVPVDAAVLGASLEAWKQLSPQVHTLREIHSSGRCMFSKLPQELLDLITANMYHDARAILLKRWQAQFTCFQGQCTKAVHYPMNDGEVEDMWEELCLREPLPSQMSDTPTDLTLEEKRQEVEDWLNEDRYIVHEDMCGSHDCAVEAWIGQFCLCRWNRSGNGTVASSEGKFVSLQQVLKRDFGLEAMILHEAFSPRMTKTLPETRCCTAIGYFTSCFLVLPDESTADDNVSANASFLKLDNHLAFHQRFDVAGHTITQEQRSSFPKALQVLDMQPKFHITELEHALRTQTGDVGWQSYCSTARSFNRFAIEAKSRQLKRYIQEKDNELRMQEWPQLILAAASDVVAPEHQIV